MRTIEQRLLDLEKQVSDNSATIKGIEMFLYRKFEVKVHASGYECPSTDMARPGSIPTTGSTQSLEFLVEELQRAQRQKKCNKNMFEQASREYGYSQKKVITLEAAIAALK